MENLADAFLRLDRKEIALLKAIERGMRHSEWVLAEELMRKARLSPKAVSGGLSKLVDRKLVFKTAEPYEGYQIGFAAYDLVALSDLVDRNVVVSLGDLLGVGKESVVYEALGRIPVAAGREEGGGMVDEEETALVPLAVKFHRLGRTSFKHVRRARDHLRDQPRCAWIHAARLGAAKEMKILKRLYPEVSVPRPVALSHHALVMEHTGGRELRRLDLENPKECFDIILEEVARAWKKEIVHADLSAYNVLVRDDGEIVLIDWPQAVYRSDQRAAELLERDLSNIVDHFARKYRLDLEFEEALAFVVGEGRRGDGGGRETGREIALDEDWEIEPGIDPGREGERGPGVEPGRKNESEPGIEPGREGEIETGIETGRDRKIAPEGETGEEISERW